MGKRMEDHLRFAIAYWHTFVWPGTDPLALPRYPVRDWDGRAFAARLS